MWHPPEREGPPLPQLVAEAQEGSKAVLPPMAIVWACSSSVDAYAAQGRSVEVPEASCPTCTAVMSPWSGYWRFVREAGRCHHVFVVRGRCPTCRCTHAVLPAFLVRNRLDTAEAIGAVVEAVAEGRSGVRPAAKLSEVPYTTARGWVRSFALNAGRLTTSFAALCVELGGDVAAGVDRSARGALAAIDAAWDVASDLPGWLTLGRWRFCSAVCGGSLIAVNTNSPYLVVGRRRFMPPVP